MAKKIVNLFALASLFFSFACLAQAESLRWVYSYDEALRQAKSEGKPIMIDFYAEWCGWCKKLDSETYKDSRVIQAAQKFICLKLDGDKYPQLAQQYGVRGYPAIFFADSQGKVVGGGSGYRSADKLLSEMDITHLKCRVLKSQQESETSAEKIIKSSVSAIGAFAKDWGWSKERNQDGEFAETKLSIKLPASFKKATLVLQHSYSQQSGEAKADVYLSTQAQVAPEDEAHHKGNWWVGKAVKPGQAVGSFSTQYQAGLTRLDVTAFLRAQPAQTYYVAVKNLDLADIGLGQIYIEIEEPASIPSPEKAAPPVKEAPPQPSMMERAVGKSHNEALKEYWQKAEEVKATRKECPAFKDIDEAFPSTVNGLERRESDKDEWGRRFATYVASDARTLTNEEVIKGLKVYAVIPDHIMVTILEDTKRASPISPGDWKNKAESTSNKIGGKLIYVDDFPVIYKVPFNNPKASVEFDLDYYNIYIVGANRYANEEEMKKAAKDMIDHFLKVAK